MRAVTCSLILIACLFGVPAHAEEQRPNILVIWGDDIGMWNVGAYTHGMMGRTPNIDSIAKDGILFTDHYGQPSCTAGRAAFITGQMPVRTGMTTIGIPGSTRGIQKEDPTLAEVLKSTAITRPSSARTTSATATSSCRRCTALTSGSAISTTSTPKRSRKSSIIRARRTRPTPGGRSARRAARLGHGRGRPDGRSEVWPSRQAEDRKHRAADSQAHGDLRRRGARRDPEVPRPKGKDDKPFFIWFNTTAIHIWSHPPQKYIQMAVDEGRAEQDVYRAKMIEHDEQVGTLLQKLKDLGVADNTIVVYSTDNGNELMLWPDGGYAPFRGEKGTTWEGGVRVPC